MTNNKEKLLDLIKNCDDNKIKVVSKIINYCIEHPEIYDMPEEQQKQILQSIA